MPKGLRLEPHPTVEELGRRYRKARDPVGRSHYQIVWLLARGEPTEAVSEATGYSRGWVRRVARRYNEGGAEGHGDRRHRKPGGAERALLDLDQREELGEALGGRRPTAGCGAGARWPNGSRRGPAGGG